MMKKSNLNEQIINDLFLKQDKKYQQFHSNLCPGTGNIIGVRVPILRNYVKVIIKEIPDYLNQIDYHNFKFYEELMIYGLYIATSKLRTDELLEKLDTFVPLIDNWAICDIVCSSIKIKKQDQKNFYKYLKKYKNSKKEFERRFFVVMLFKYLNDEYIDKVIKELDTINTNEYYVSMAVAWLISIIYIKYKDKAIDYLNNNNLDTKTYNKALQKIIESTRISKEEKEQIKILKK